MAEHKDSHDHRPADAAKHSANGANGGAMHPKGAHGDLNEDIRGLVDENTTLKLLSSTINSKESEISEVISALKKLGEMSSKKAVLELDKFLEEQEKNHEGRRTSAIPHALIALGKTEDMSMSIRIIKWMHDKHPDVRAAVADSFSYLGDIEYSKAVADMLKDHDDKVRFAAVKALGIIGDDSVILSVCALAADPSSEVRAESVKSVVAILKKDLKNDISGERLQRLLVLAKTVKDSFIKLEKGEKISLVRDSFDICINDITTILLSHRVKEENQQIKAEIRQKLDTADRNIGDLADENHELRNEIKDLKKKLEGSMLSKGDMVNKFIDLKARVEKSEKLITEAEALKQEVETLREQLGSEENRRRASGGTEKDLQRQVLTYKREVEEAAKLVEIQKRQIAELQAALQSALSKAGAEINKSKNVLEEIESIGKEHGIEDRIEGMKTQLDENTDAAKESEEKSKQLKILESRLKESDDKVKALESRMKEKDMAGLENMTSALTVIESKHKSFSKKTLGYKIGLGFLTAAVLIEAGLLVRSTLMIRNQNAKMAKISDTNTKATNFRVKDATQKLSMTETVYKEISSMDFVIGKFFTDPEAIISLHYKKKNKAEARQILDECRDKYWEVSDRIKDIGPEKACEEMRKYYLLVDLIGSGKLEEAKGKYKDAFGKEFKLMVF